MKRIKISSIGLLILLASANVFSGISIDGQLTYEKTLKPGEVYHGSLKIQNTGDKTEDVKVYQTDYRFFFNGQNEYADPGTIARSNAKWIKIDQNRLTIQPKSTMEVLFTLTVPEIDSLIGTFWSMIMVEGQPETTPESVQSSVGINTIMRYGVQIVSHVKEKGKADLKFLDIQVAQNEEAKTVLQIDIENVGQSWLRPMVWIEVYDSAGAQIEKLEGVQLRTYPGTSIRQNIDIGKIPSGEYQALVVADCGDDNLFGLRYSFKME